MAVVVPLFWINCWSVWGRLTMPLLWACKYSVGVDGPMQTVKHGKRCSVVSPEEQTVLSQWSCRDAG